MYKSISLKVFKKQDWCNLNDSEVKQIKREIEGHINTLNKGIHEGKDWRGNYMQYYDGELSGMRNLCSFIGIRTRLNYEKDEEFWAKK